MHLTEALLFSLHCASFVATLATRALLGVRARDRWQAAAALACEHPTCMVHGAAGRAEPPLAAMSTWPHLANITVMCRKVVPVLEARTGATLMACLLASAVASRAPRRGALALAAAWCAAAVRAARARCCTRRLRSSRCCACCRFGALTRSSSSSVLAQLTVRFGCACVLLHALCVAAPALLRAACVLELGCFAERVTFC